jgi:UDP-N-acetyl-D-glucosamine/UDP-N-acetyl-D-galactosamine dehydrogenase
METKVISVIGLGYVGLPLAVEFAKKFKVYGFDINSKRVDELKMGIDTTLEVESNKLKSVLNGSSNEGLILTTNVEDIREADFYIVTVPTPVDSNKNPDFIPLIKASETVGKVISKDNIVIYESTVYPGATEEICIPVVEKTSGLVFNKDFFAGYSPERINPGDKVHTVENILKVTAGSTAEIGIIVDNLYKTIIKAGTHLAPNIKVAEASKVIENAQRDLNISFVNELALIFDKLDIDTRDVIEAAGTKWNFLKFTPGLVGGHCISVDPYYLAHVAEKAGYYPQVIRSGRRVNDEMGRFVAGKVVKLLIKKNHQIGNSNILVLGITFKENCPDIRNTKVVDVVSEMMEYTSNIDIYDPYADPQEVKEAYGYSILSQKSQLTKKYDAIIHAVAHGAFQELELNKMLNKDGVIYDIKSTLPRDIVDGRL